MASQTTKIAITGHRDLRPEDLPKIEKKVREKLTLLIHGKKASQFKLLSGMAEGADRLVATIATELGIGVETVLAYAEEKVEIPNTFKIDSFTILNDERKPENTEGGYEKLGKYLVDNSDYLIALWDGVFNGKKGGTSEVVRMAMESTRPITILHLVVPRQQNPYPVASLLQQGLSFHLQKFQRIPFTVHFSWVELVVNIEKKDNQVVSFLKGIWSELRSEVFLQFVVPTILILTTLVLGTKGFLELDAKNNFHNALFKSVNLLTFNNSVIEQDSMPLNSINLNIYQTSVSLKLNIARYLGLFTAFSAFLIALYYALGIERKRLKIILWKTFCTNKYVIVLGLGEKSYDLIIDLIRKEKKVAVLASNDDSNYKSELERLGAVFIKGNISSVKLLQRIYYTEATEIYIMSDADIDNVRATQELDRITEGVATNQKWFSHIQDNRLRTFLYNNLSKESRHRLFIFDIYENTARRLQLYHPFDRFYQTAKAKETHIVVFGFDNLGKQIVLNSLRQGHFEKDKKLKISVFCIEAAIEQNRFEQSFPIFKSDNSQQKHLEAIKKDIWQNDVLNFYELPQSDADLLSRKSILFNEIITKNHIVSIYACFEDGLTSGAYLSVLLPKLNYYFNKYLCNLQVFCFYNFPDKKEEKITEKHFNKLAPNIPVFCFGNFIDECSAGFINDLALDALPKQIAYWYAQNYGDSKQTIEDVWRDCSEQDKEANRQAADHLWIKLRTTWSVIDWNFDIKTFRPLVEDLSIIKKYEQILSEVEHRRWCGDLLIKGFRPLQDEANSEEQMEDLRRDWFDKGAKKTFKDQKLHIDLIPFNDLTEKEKEKDLSQIQNIPEFLQKIVKV
jgi:hypothetical protein